MRHLSPHLPYDPAETTSSFVARLALFHVGSEPNRFLADLGFDTRAFSRGEPAAITRLAEIAEIDPDLLQAGAIRRVERFREFRGERWSRRFVAPQNTRVCPRCLALDLQENKDSLMKERILWRLRPFATCPDHGVNLVDLPRPSPSDRYAELPAAAFLDALAATQRCRSVTGLERWIASRITGSRGDVDAWFDAQTLEQGTRACEMLGLVLDRGPKANVRSTTHEQWRDAAEIGFEFARQGPAAVQEAFEIIRSKKVRAGNAGPKATYGRIYEWLSAKNPHLDFGPIRDLLREHILNTTAIKAGELLLGEEVTERRTHSIHSLSLATGLHRKRLRKVLVEVGLVPKGASEVAYNHLVFSAVESEEVCYHLASVVPLLGLPDYLDCSRTQAKSLHKDGVLVPLLTPCEKSKIRLIGFSRRQLDEFLAKISKLPLREDGEDIVNLYQAARTTGMRTGTIMGMLLNGDLPACRVEGRVGLSNIRVAIESVAQFQHPGRFRSKD